MVGPLWEQKGSANDLKRSVREHFKELALCMVWEHKKHFIMPVLLTARVTEKPPPRRGRDQHLLSIKQMRESAKLCQDKEGVKEVGKKGYKPQGTSKKGILQRVSGLHYDSKFCKHQAQ